MPALDSLVRQAPKVELHLHLEGTLEPELMMTLAERHRVSLPYRTVDDVRAAYRFDDLQSFLDLYYLGAGVLREADDFDQLTWAYLLRMRDEGTRHVEVFFDPQTHTGRGTPFDEVVDGIGEALARAERQLGITSLLIACVLRHLPATDGETVLDQVLRHPGRIAGLGLDSTERDNPPGRFANVFARARANGLHVVAHAGEEGPASYVAEALDVLRVERIDHGVRSLEDPHLVARLAELRTPLTVCPLSNVALRVVPDLASHPLRRLLDAGLAASVHSDDPAYFGGYLTANLLASIDALQLGIDHVERLLRNAIDASFAPRARRADLHQELDRTMASTAS